MSEPADVFDDTPGTEIVQFRPRNSLNSKLAYADKLAASGLLPKQYQRNPANVLYAVEYGEMLGLPAMAAITGIHVIEGKPTASSALIGALVRRAGHKLRVTGNDQKAVVQIIRKDDPDFTFEATWTLDRAKQANLTGKSVWKQYPAAMLKARAITECARDACEEALSGVLYTPEEMGAEVDEEGMPTVEQVQSSPVDWDAEIRACAGDRAKLLALHKRAAGNAEVQARIVAEGKKAAAVKTKPAEEKPADPEPQPEVVDAEIVEDEPRKTLTVEDTVDILIECDIFDAAENIRKRGQSDDVKDFLDEQVCEVLGLKHGVSLRLDHFASKVATFVKRHGYSVVAGIDKPASGSVEAA